MQIWETETGVMSICFIMCNISGGKVILELLVGFLTKVTC